MAEAFGTSAGAHRRSQSAPPGHPARGRSSCRGRSPGSRVDTAVRPSRNLAGFSDVFGQRLAAYSCGGSSGIARSPAGIRHTEFPLSSDARAKGSENHDGDSVSDRLTAVKDIKVSLYSRPSLRDAPDRDVEGFAVGQAGCCAQLGVAGGRSRSTQCEAFAPYVAN